MKAAEPLRVLCVSRDGSTAAGVAAMLASLPDFVFAARTAGYGDPVGQAQAQELDLVFVVLDDEPATGLGIVESLRRSARAAHVVAVSPDDDPDIIVRTVRAGADEHLALPLSQHDLFKICIKVAEVCRGTATRERPGGDLWVVHSPKGGVGVTTLVVNLAIALRAAQRDVAVVDLDVYAGDTAFFLNLEPTYTLRDVVKHERLDAVAIRGAMMRHPSGLAILAAPSAGRGAPPAEPTAEQTIDVLELVTGMHELTVVNTPRIPSEATRAALTAADRVLLVTDLTVPALRGCVRTIDWLAGEGMDPTETVEVIVNRSNPRATEVSTTDVSRMMQAPVRAVLPWDEVAALSAANAGRPLADGTPLQRAIAELASPGGPAPEASRIKRSLARLFSSSPA
jgi:pilus assembly protein CpaE